MNLFLGPLCAQKPSSISMIDPMIRAFCLSLLITMIVSVQAHANVNTPTIRLFPTTVVEDLRQTSSVAQEMESGLQEVIGRLDQQQSS